MESNDCNEYRNEYEREQNALKHLGIYSVLSVSMKRDLSVFSYIRFYVIPEEHPEEVWHIRQC